MTLKTFSLRFAGLILIALAALPLLAITINGLVLFNAIPQDLVDQAFGNVLTQKAMFVWMGCLPLAFAAIFIGKSWAKLFYFSPLYAPSLFTVIYTAIQN